MERLLEYNPAYDIELIGKAYDVAEKTHRRTVEEIGENPLIHPIAVSEILAELGMDEETIIWSAA